VTNDQRDKCSCYHVSEHSGVDADRYATDHLEEVRTDSVNWLVEYRCPPYGKRWLRDQPWGERMAVGQDGSEPSTRSVAIFGPIWGLSRLSFQMTPRRWHRWPLSGLDWATARRCKAQNNVNPGASAGPYAFK
jgi:hypothetical protein